MTWQTSMIHVKTLFYHFTVLFLYTIDLRNTKTKSELNKRTTEPYLIYGDQIGEMKKVKKTHICIHKYFLQSFLAEIRHLIKKGSSNLCNESLIYRITCIKTIWFFFSSYTWLLHNKKFYCLLVQVNVITNKLV